MKQATPYRYFLTIRIQCGEYTFREYAILESGKTEYIERYVGELWPCRDKENGDGKPNGTDGKWFFHNGLVAAMSEGAEEITEEEAKIINRFLS
jgi:hypothetical protein